MKNAYLLLLGASLLFSSCAGLFKSGAVMDDVYYIPSEPKSSNAYTSLLERSSVSRMQRGVVKDSSGSVDYFDESYQSRQGMSGNTRSYTDNPYNYAGSAYNSSYFMPQLGLTYGLGRYCNSYPYSYNPYYDMSMYNNGYYGYNSYSNYNPYYSSYYNNAYSGYYSNGPLNPYYTTYNTVTSSSAGTSVRPYSTSGYSSSSDGVRNTYGRRTSMSSRQVVMNSSSATSADNQKRKSSVVSTQGSSATVINTTRVARPVLGTSNSSSNSSNSSSTSNYNNSYNRSNNQSAVSYPSTTRSSSNNTGSYNSSNFSRPNNYNSTSSGGGSRSGSGRR